DVSNILAAPRDVSFREPVGVSREVRVVEDYVLVGGRELVDGDAALLASEEFDDAPVRRGEDGRVARGHYVYRVVYAPLAARVREGVAQLLGPHALDRNQ